MNTLAERRLELRAAHGARQSRLRLPNPGDVFMLAAFGWAAVCFLLVTGGQRFARQVARLGRSETVSNLVLTEQTAIAGIMIAGLIGLGVTFFFLTRFRWVSIGLFLFSMSFASALWPPLHDLAFAIKYLIIIYLASYATLFFYRNGWRLIDTKGYRLVCVYVAWIGFIAVYNGLKVGDVWYFGTEFCLMIGFGIAWLRDVDTTDKLRKFNMVFAFAAIAVTLGHMLSPLVFPEYTYLSRFVSMFERATGFSVTYAPYVVVLFWASMYDKNAVRQRVFSAFAVIGFGLILWSGTRNATVATLIGVFGLWWVFRTKLLVYVVAAGMIGLLVQIVIGGNEDLALLGERLASLKNTRSDLWELYLGLAKQSPLLGYGWDGLTSAVYGESLVNAIGNFIRVTIPAVHNHYLGFLVRFGMVGLILNLMIIVLPLLRAWRVVFSPNVALQDKQVYVLPAALLLVVVLEGLFEDTMGSTGKGTLHGLIFALAIPVVYLFGGQLLNAANAEQSRRAPVARTLRRELS
ncbi:MAG: O-antigen ligase family protein [Gammaproteobacteria bacterium]|jgi:O-antigen ligase|nr:O-antigen ligase family protein [Gammaproteobacteria bacterium]